MDDLLEGIRKQVDLAARPIDVTEVLAVVARRDNARRRRTTVIRSLLAASFVVLIGIAVNAVAFGPSGRSGVSTGPVVGAVSCGAYDVSLQQMTEATNFHQHERQCILDAFAAGDEALLRVQWPTVEGTPVAAYYLVTGKREVAVFVDATDDPFGSEQVVAQSCTGLQVVARGPLLATDGCNRPTECGAFDVATDWDAAGREPVASGVQCLMDAFDEGRPATMSFSYTSDDTRLHWAYLVEAPDEVLVAASRQGPEVPPELRFTIERCSALVADDSGSPVVPPSSCSLLHPGPPASGEGDVGPIVVSIEDASGRTWEFDVYEGDGGLCMDHRGSGPGFCSPVPLEGERAVTFAWGGSPELPTTVHGMARLDVSRIEIHLASGLVLHATPEGQDAGFPVNFFAATGPADTEIAVVVAFGPGGEELERVTPSPRTGPADGHVGESSVLLERDISGWGGRIAYLANGSLQAEGFDDWLDQHAVTSTESAARILLGLEDVEANVTSYAPTATETLVVEVQNDDSTSGARYVVSFSLEDGRVTDMRSAKWGYRCTRGPDTTSFKPRICP